MVSHLTDSMRFECCDLGPITWRWSYNQPGSSSSSFTPLSRDVFHLKTTGGLAHRKHDTTSESLIQHALPFRPSFPFNLPAPCGLIGVRPGSLLNYRLQPRRSKKNRQSSHGDSILTYLDLFGNWKNRELSYLINPQSLWNVNIFFVKPRDLACFQPTGLYFCVSFYSPCSWHLPCPL